MQTTLLNPRVLLVCLGLAIAVAAALSLRWFSQYQPLTALGGGLPGADQFALEADNVQVVGRGGGTVHWRMTAQTVALSSDRRTITVTGIRRGTLYGDAGRPSALVSADRAVYGTPFGSLGPGSAGNLSVSGHVTAHVLSAGHPMLQTEQMEWNSVSSVLTCPVSVTARLPKLTVTAGNAAYTSPPDSPLHGVLHLGGGVQARIDTTRGLAVLNCPGLTWSADGQSAQTLGAVSAQIPGGFGTATAADITVSTRTGDLVGHGLRGTLHLSSEVQ